MCPINYPFLTSPESVMMFRASAPFRSFIWTLHRNNPAKVSRECELCVWQEIIAVFAGMRSLMGDGLGGLAASILRDRRNTELTN